MHKLVYTRTSGPRYPPQLSNFERSELGGSWRRLSEKKNISCKLRVCHVRVTVDLPTFCLVTIFSVESKELELELGQPKKIFAIPVFIKELGKYIQKKFNKYVNIER